MATWALKAALCLVRLPFRIGKVIKIFKLNPWSYFLGPLQRYAGFIFAFNSFELLTFMLIFARTIYGKITYEKE